MSPALVAALAERLPPNEAPERPLMQLATVDDAGAPDLRTVLLTAWDAGGFLFNTDRASRKAAQLEDRADVALCLVAGFGGQIVVQGRAAAQTPDEERVAWLARSPYLRQLAWQNTADLAAAAPDDRRRRWAAFGAEHDLSALEPAPGWVGFRVVPSRVTLWTPDAAGPSHRVEHRLTDGGVWSTVELPG